MKPERDVKLSRQASRKSFSLTTLARSPYFLQADVGEQPIGLEVVLAGRRHRLPLELDFEAGGEAVDVVLGVLDLDMLPVHQLMKASTQRFIGVAVLVLKQLLECVVEIRLVNAAVKA